MTAPALQVDGLSAGYARRRVIRDLSLPPLPAGTITAVIGPNAAGKTTLLRALAGLLPAKGRVGFDGRDLLGLPPAALARLVTYMPQTLPQGIALSVVESLIAAQRATPAGGESSAAYARAEAALELFGLASLALSALDRLSGGQRQLVSLAQVLVRQPRILLLDEPTSALDPRHQIAVMERLRAVTAERGMVVLAVLHDLNLALRWADRIVLLAEGGLAAAGPPEEALTPATLAAAYRVVARIERCSQGRPQVLFDGVLP